MMFKWAVGYTINFQRHIMRYKCISNSTIVLKGEFVVDFIKWGNIG